jgi:E3 ubiquitin-protein ligase RAD18
MERATTPQATDKGISRKRKRSPENSSSFDALGNVAGPSCNPMSPRSPAALKSPSRLKKSKPTAEEIIDMTVPSSDIEEDETTPILAPKGMFQVLLE